MRLGELFACVAIAGLMAGCVTSQHPFYQESQTVDDPVGRAIVAEIAKNEKGPPRQGGNPPKIQSDEHRGHYQINRGDDPIDAEAVVFRMGDHFFVDLGVRDEQHSEAHLLYMLLVTGNDVIDLPLENKHRLIELLRADGSVSYTGSQRHGDDLQLTDETGKIQAFLQKTIDRAFVPNGTGLDAYHRCDWRPDDQQFRLPVTDDAGLGGREQRTLAYWWLIGQALRERTSGKPAWPEFSMEADEFVSFAAGLSMLGVDDDAVTPCSDLIDLFRAASKRGHDPLVQKFPPEPLNAATYGEAAGLAADDLKARGVFAKSRNELRDEFTAAAERLNKRYRVRFNPMPF